MVKTQLSIYYDGGCHLCSREIDHYRKKDTKGRLEFVDIENPSFDPKSLGVTKKQVHKFFHAKDAEGEIYVGVDAFIKIWQTLENYRGLARVANFWPVRSLLKVIYPIFAEIRPLLPRKKSCESGQCHSLSSGDV